MSEERFNRLEQRLDGIDGRLDGMDSRLNGIDGRIEGVDRRIDDLDRHMHVLHEDVISRIAAIPEYTGPTKAEMDRGFADLKEAIERRLDPLEATVRQHTSEIDRLKQARE